MLNTLKSVTRSDGQHDRLERLYLLTVGLYRLRKMSRRGVGRAALAERSSDFDANRAFWAMRTPCEW